MTTKQKRRNISIISAIVDCMNETEKLPSTKAELVKRITKRVSNIEPPVTQSEIWTVLVTPIERMI